VSNGIVDAFVHVMEQYLTYPSNAPLQDRMAESILSTLIEEGPKTLANLTDYDARANVMWCATMALNGLIGAGVPQDWATHMIGHELTALHGLDHAQTLAIVLPSVMAFKQNNKREKILQYAQRVWKLTEGSEEHRIDKAIAKTRQFFEAVGVPTHLSNYQIGADDIPNVLKNLETHGRVGLGEKQDIQLDAAEKILTLSI
jgi:NADP-dependent alcohol dehydrogenase